VELELKSPEVCPYHGRAYPVPKVHEKLVREEAESREALQTQGSTACQ
jgi:hypothetical protein